MVSIIIVNYKVKNELFDCLDSIYKSKPKVDFEIIVVDNDEEMVIDSELRERFPGVVYVKSRANLGFGAGNNLGVKYAKGDYLFFLNPDTLVFKDCVDSLVNFLKQNKKTGIVAPVLLDEKNNLFKLQGLTRLTPFKAFFTLSFINKFFPNNPISRKYYLSNWNHKTLKEVDVCPGTAFMISTEIFKKTGGFDEKFFLYFEEHDLCDRVKSLGLKIFMIPKSKVIHKWEISTKTLKDRDKIFSESRFRYFRKHYGLLKALPVELFLRINKLSIFVILLFFSSFFLRIYNLEQNMVFIGDQGWFYLSARDLLISGQIPLVGITSSHTWLHQGPLWTYMLSVVLFLFKFNPISGGYLTALFGAATVFLMYKLGSEMFSKKIGIIASLLYAVSPLIVFSDRMPFDPSPIPFFTLLYLYSLYKWVSGNVKYFPVIIFLLAILYNLELATFTLVFPFAVIFIYAAFKKRVWLKDIFTKKIMILSLVAVLIPMLPVIIYDFSSGFKQTIVFLGWTLYKPFSFLIKHSSGNFVSNTTTVLNFLAVNLQKIIFGFSMEIALLLFVLSLLFLIYKVFKKGLRINSPKFLLLFLLSISLLGILLNQTPSDAYLPIIFPFVIFLIAIFLGFLVENKVTKYIGIVVLSIILAINLLVGIQLSQTHEFENRLKAVNQVIKIANGNRYNLIGKGPGSQFESFTMNYEYLLWWKGNPPSRIPVPLRIIILENGKTIKVSR